MGTLVNYATDKGAALLTLNNPPVNAYTHEMFKELDAKSSKPGSMTTCMSS